MIAIINPVRAAMVTPIVVILCFLFFGVSHVLWFSPQPGDPVNQGEDETHEGNSCISMMTPRCHRVIKRTTTQTAPTMVPMMRPLRGARWYCCSVVSLWVVIVVP